MKAIVCELCGSNELVKTEGVFVCQHCGTKYTLDEAKKIFFEQEVTIVGAVKLDVSEKVKNLYEIARRARKDNNSENASKYYEMILLEKPLDWEAAFYSVLFKSKSCRFLDMVYEINNFRKCLSSVLVLVSKYVDETEQEKVVTEIVEKTLDTCITFNNVAIERLNGIEENFRGEYVKEFVEIVSAVADVLYELGNEVEKIFSDNGTLCEKASVAWKKGVSIHSDYVMYCVHKNANEIFIGRYVDKIKKYDPKYVAPKIKTVGCYIATAVYGAYDCPEVWALRRFRDSILAQKSFGKALIKLYYFISPFLVRNFGKTRFFNIFFKWVLDKFVKTLKARGIKDTPYMDGIHMRSKE